MPNISGKSFFEKTFSEKLVYLTSEPGKVLQKAVHSALSPAGTRSYRSFLVLSRSRTGSNMLIQSLNSHPGIAADYEIFAKLSGRAEADILDRAYGRQPFYIQAKGFKIFYYHPQDATGSPVWDMLQAVEGLHVIHLKRRNILHALVSSRVAYQTGIYGVRSDREAARFQEAVPQVRFTPEELERDFRQTRQWERDGAARFAGKPILDVDYEDMVADLPGQFRRITDFLGVAPRPPRTDFKKQRTRSLWDTVENYGELRSNFRGSVWEHFFDE